jgi:hypothetical protein
MKTEKKFKFDAEQAALISSSFDQFRNDTVKAIAAHNIIGGTLPVVKPPAHSKLSWDRTVVTAI